MLALAPGLSPVVAPVLVSLAVLQAAEPPAAPPKRPPAPTVVTPAPTRLDAALEADVELLRRLDKPYPADAAPKYADTPAKDVVEAIRKETKVPIDIDRRVVGDSGGWEWQRVTCEPATPRAALDAVVRAISPAYDAYKVDVAAGVVVFTDDAGRRTLRAAAPYELGALAARANELGAADGEDAGDGDAAAAGVPGASRLGRLLDAILAVEGDSWTELGGEIGRIASVTGTVAVIETSPAIHKAIRDRLAAISGALPPARILWSVEFLEVPAGASDKAIATALGAEALPATLDAGWERLSAPQLVALRSEPASILIGGEGDALSVAIERVDGSAPGAYSGAYPGAYLVRLSDTRGERSRDLELRVAAGVASAAFVGDARSGGLIVRIRGEGISDERPANPKTPPAPAAGAAK